MSANPNNPTFLTPAEYDRLYAGLVLANTPALVEVQKRMLRDAQAQIALMQVAIDDWKAHTAKIAAELEADLAGDEDTWEDGYKQALAALLGRL